MTDYERIACIIRYLDDHHFQQPDIETLAKKIGLSSFHFHCLFTKWAAITPKNFLQCLTLSHAKELLKEGASILDAALATGLSGPGRLHDLCVNLESASPGELKAGGKGWILSVGFSESPFGRCLLADGPRGICHLSFIEQDNDDEALAALQESWPEAVMHRDDTFAKKIAGRIFERPSRAPSDISIKAYVRGTAFQVCVWRALLQVKHGTLVSYGRLAKVIGQPSAARAVGSAVGRNSLAFLIPCHRVIRDTGIVGDYRWGQIRKQAMVAWESSTHFAARANGSEKTREALH